MDKDKIAHDLAVAAMPYYVDLPDEDGKPLAEYLAADIAKGYKSLYKFLLEYFD